MKTSSIGLSLLLLASTAFACTPTAVTPTVTATFTPTELPTVTPTATPAYAYTPGSGECTITATDFLPVYERPTIASGLFGTLTPYDSAPASVYTADGWIGFEPGVAQAANVGIFRYRWVETGGPFTLQGNCGSLQLVVGPPAGVCFDQPMTDTPVYAAPDMNSAVLVEMHPGDYAAVIGTLPGWYEVDLSSGNLGIRNQGWVAQETVNFNGPCEALPAVTPP